MLIFDLDGTLIDSNGIWIEVDKTFLSRRNAPYTPEYYQGVAHTILQNCIWRRAVRRSSRSGWSWPRTPTAAYP